MKLPNSRREIRQQIRKKRNQLSAAERRHAAAIVTRYLSRDPIFVNSRRIAFYFPNDNELDITPLIQTAWNRKKRCYLPVLTRLGQNSLLFARYTPKTRLVSNRFGIPEPVAISKKHIPAQNIDLIFTPLVAFDVNGNRLGMGGGYYDRTLQFLKYRQIWQRPRLVGIAYDFQKLPSLECQSWDIPLDRIITEKQRYISASKKIQP